MESFIRKKTNLHEKIGFFGFLIYYIVIQKM